MTLESILQGYGGGDNNVHFLAAEDVADWGRLVGVGKHGFSQPELGHVQNGNFPMVRHVSASIFGHQLKFQENWWPKIDANFGLNHQ